MASLAAHAAICGRSASRMQVKPVGMPSRAFMAKIASIKALALSASLTAAGHHQRAAGAVPGQPGGDVRQTAGAGDRLRLTPRQQPCAQAEHALIGAISNMA